MSVALVLYDCFNVREIEIDKRRRGDKISNAAYAHTKIFVGVFQRFYHRSVRRESFEKFVVGNNNDSINDFAEFRYSSSRVFVAAFALEHKRLRDDRNRNATALAGDLRNDRSRARSRSAAHTSGDKKQIHSLQAFSDFVFAFLGCLHAYFGV